MNNINKFVKYIKNPLSRESDILEKLDEIKANLDKLPKKEIKQIDEKFLEILDSYYDSIDVEVLRNLIFYFQHAKELGKIINEEYTFNILTKLIHSKTVQGKYKVSNAVSLTIRKFYQDNNFSEKKLREGFYYILENMKPIKKGFGSRRCQVCWNKTLKEIAERLGIYDQINVKKKIDRIVKLNLFHDDLEHSYDTKIKKKLNQFYKKYFKNVKIIITHESEKKLDRERQKQGIDKTIVKNDGEEIYIEEKFRRSKYWDFRDKDILIEYISIDNKNIPGWIYTSQSDFILILYESPQEIEYDEFYIFPFKVIRDWIIKEKDWFMGLQDLRAPNYTWYTISKAVPIDDLFNMLKEKGLENYTTKYKIKN